MAPILPPDIAALFDLARDPHLRFEWPASFAAAARAHGLEGLKFPCQVGAGMLTRTAVRQELTARLREIDNLPGSFKGSFSDRIMTVFRFVVAACTVMNVLSAALAVSLRPREAGGIPMARLAGDLVAAIIHGMLYNSMSEVQSTMRRLARTGLAGAVEAGNQNLSDIVQERLRQMNVENRGDLSRMALAMAALAGANYAISRLG